MDGLSASLNVGGIKARERGCATADSDLEQEKKEIEEQWKITTNKVSLRVGTDSARAALCETTESFEAKQKIRNHAFGSFHHTFHRGSKSFDAISSTKQKGSHLLAGVYPLRTLVILAIAIAQNRLLHHAALVVAPHHRQCT